MVKCVFFPPVYSVDCMDIALVWHYQRNHGDLADMRLNVAVGVREGLSSRNYELPSLRGARSGLILIMGD